MQAICVLDCQKQVQALPERGHPGRSILTRVGRALSILVTEASAAVRSRVPQHTPMWKLHEGSKLWVGTLAARPAVRSCAEFDVEDCYLNTTREMVLPALDFWLRTDTAAAVFRHQ